MKENCHCTLHSGFLAWKVEADDNMLMSDAPFVFAVQFAAVIFVVS
jgi:hypothetical protein